MSNYRLNFKLTNPATKECLDIWGKVSFVKSPNFDYGNETYMRVEWDDHRLMGQDGYYDIRYDRRYRSGKEAEYIKQFIRQQYTGENGAWAASGIVVKEL